MFDFVSSQSLLAFIQGDSSLFSSVGLFSGLLAFATAFLFSLAELITGSYPRTISLFFRKSKALYLYGLLYGMFGLLVAIFLDSLISSEQVSIEGLGTENPWIRSLMIGISIKGFMKISLFNVTGNSASNEPFPVGPASIVQLFEPSLLIQIGLDEFNSIGDFLTPYLSNLNHTDVNHVRVLILENLPRLDSSAYRAGMVEDFKDESKSIKQLMELYLVYFGASAFSRLFDKTSS